MKLKIKGGTYDSMEQFEAALKQNSNGPVTKLSSGQTLTVRFLSEPTGWLGFEEHYTDEFKYFPCTDEGCPGCDEGHRASSRHLAPAVDVNSNRVIVIQLPKGLAEGLLRRWKRSKTVMDRDYDLIREGEGLDTKYEAEPGEQSKRNLNKYEIPDLERALILNTSDEFREYVGVDLTEDDDDEEDVKPRKKTAAATSKRRGAAAATTKKRRRPVIEEDDEDEDDEDDYDEDEDEDEDDYEDDEEEEDEDDEVEVIRRKVSATRKAVPARREAPARRKAAPAPARRRKQSKLPPF